MRRQLARLLFVFVVGSLAMVLGVVTSMTLSPPGRDLLARTVSKLLDRIVTGQVKVGAISGSFLYDLTLENLVVRDTSGALLADLPRARVSYRLPNLIAGQVVLSGLELDRPTIQLIKHRNGRMNYEEVLGIGKGSKGGKSPLVEFHNVQMTGGTLRIALPWNPAKSARTEASVDSALRSERAKPGRLIEQSPEGLRRVIILADLATKMSRLRIATPDRLPFTIDLDSLATRVNDPGVTLRNAVGRIRIRGDSAVFSLSRGALPDTRFSGGGAVTWPRDTILFDFQVISPQVNLEDLRWVSPNFPAMTGRGILTARSETGARTAYDIRDLHLRGVLGQVDGELVTITDKRRGLGVRDMSLRLAALDLDAVRPYLDTLPFSGTVTGKLAGSGFLNALDLSLEWAFRDASVPENPLSTITGEGGVGASRDSGLIFTNFGVRQSDIDLRTVRRIAPAVILPGRLIAVGSLNGPLRNVTFNGTAQHQDLDRPPSLLEGTVHLDTRFQNLGLATDVTLDPLSFEGIRRAFPSLKAQGELRGRFQSRGTLADLVVDASLAGQAGTFDAKGTVTVLPPRWGAEDLLLRFSSLNLQALTGRKLPTSLNGELSLSGKADTVHAPEGELHLALSRSRIREFTLDSVHAVAGLHDSLIRLDTAYAVWKGARVGGSGTLGWSAPHVGRMAFTLAADSLIAFDSLLLAASGQARDTSPDSRPLGGTATASVQLAGSLDTLEMSADGRIQNLEWQRIRSPEVTGAFSWIGGQRPQLTASVGSDSVMAQNWILHRLGAQARGWADSLDWSAGTGIGPTSRVDGTGRWWRHGQSQVALFDSLAFGLPLHRYRLDETFAVTLSDSAPAISPLTLRAEDGSGVIQVGGRLPGSSEGSLTVRLLGLDMHDVYGLLQRDTTGIAGDIGVDVHLGGTAEAPTMRGTMSVDAARFGDFQAPFVEGVVNYADRRLEANLLLWRTGENMLQVETQLPLDLAFRGVKQRRVEGPPLLVHARGDSVDLAILEALTPAVSRVRGMLKADVNVTGTWSAPRFVGGLEIRGGAMSLPGLGVRYDGLHGSARFQGDSLVLKDVSLRSGGSLGIGGSIFLEDLTRPVLDLDFRAQDFRAVDVRNFLTLSATGGLRLRGPLFHSLLTGNLTANSGVLYFADLVSKRIIDLEDPTIADLVDTTLLRRENLGAKFQNRFLDSLTIQNLRVVLGSDVWLRSAEANIQLGGELQLSKAAKTYTPSGTLDALRGTYTLKIGPVTRDFTVERGSVRYFGDLNASLDIQAQHVVRAVRGEEVPVIAKITGTLYAPKVSLESTLNPPISETDLVSYLVTGYPANEAARLGQANALETGLAYFSSALSSELERALIQDLGIPLDLIEIRPGVSRGNRSPSLSQLAAGWQLGRKTFVTLNAGFCPENLSQFTYSNLGASLEFRLSREWSLLTSIEPTLQSCQQAFGIVISNPYQIGSDIRWEREF
ncbi:MAG: translocation and assembly module TamB [Gemmatimonadales bacterium]|nr:translocation and assembly module TamB [Gemmatimonadales bacterium]